MASFKFRLGLNNSAVWQRLNGSVNKDMNFLSPSKTSHTLRYWHCDKLGTRQDAMIAKTCNVVARTSCEIEWQFRRKNLHQKYHIMTVSSCGQVASCQEWEFDNIKCLTVRGTSCSLSKHFTENETNSFNFGCSAFLVNTDILVKRKFSLFDSSGEA